MKLIISVFLDKLEKEINRQILVDENISLKDFCEYIIVSINGNKMPLYELICGKVRYYPFYIDEETNFKSMIDLKLKDLNLKRGRKLELAYNSSNLYYINIDVDGVNNNYYDEKPNNFEIISGKGYGILDNTDVYRLKRLLTYKKQEIEGYCIKSEKEYLEKRFDCDMCNKRIQEYKEHVEKQVLPKRYVFNVSLDCYTKEIKRKIVVNNDIPIDSFCRKVIVSMNGDLSHGYGMKIKKEYLEEEYFNGFELFYLNLEEKKKIKIIYDWGDNWLFNVTLSKVIDDYGEKDFEVLSGKGCGIMDDCGGIWRLDDLINDKNNEWGYDIDDFDLDKINKEIDKY